MSEVHLRRPIIDLHTHTTASDGSLRPAELVREAKRAGLRAVAITDHDTVDGLAEGLAAGEEVGLEVVPGVEVSAQPLLDGHLHLLGLFVDPGQPRFRRWLDGVRAGRDRRNPKIIEKLQSFGISITLEEVQRKALGGLVGRPHIAQVLVEKRVTRSLPEAFERYLSRGAVAYVERERAMPGEAIAAIHEAGGLAILAHPHYCGARDTSTLQRFIQELQGLGLDGLEIHYPTFTVDQEALFGSLARELGLLGSGGSDFHGAQKPGLELGRGHGSLRVPAELLEPLKARVAVMRSRQG